MTDEVEEEHELLKLLCYLQTAPKASITYSEQFVKVSQYLQMNLLRIQQRQQLLNDKMDSLQIAFGRLQLNRDGDGVYTDISLDDFLKVNSIVVEQHYWLPHQHPIRIFCRKLTVGRETYSIKVYSSLCIVAEII